MEDNEVAAATAETLYAAGKPELAEAYLNQYSGTRAMDGLRLGEALTGSIEARTKWKYGIARPEDYDINAGDGPTPNCLPFHDPDVSEE